MEEIKVLKREGGIESWNYDKVLTSIVKAGMSVTEAEKVALKIHDWTKKAASDEIITSNAIRDKVIELLNENNPIVSETYRAYKK